MLYLPSAWAWLQFWYGGSATAIGATPRAVPPSAVAARRMRNIRTPLLLLDLDYYGLSSRKASRSLGASCELRAKLYLRRASQSLTCGTKQPFVKPGGWQTRKRNDGLTESDPTTAPRPQPTPHQLVTPPRKTPPQRRAGRRSVGRWPLLLGIQISGVSCLRKGGSVANRSLLATK
jgi:hypothetical protein